MTRTRKLCLEFPECESLKLEAEAFRLGVSVTQILQWYLELGIAAQQAHNDGFEVGAWRNSPDGKTRKERLFVNGLTRQAA
jgi:hypothetical protein